MPGQSQPLRISRGTSAPTLRKTSSLFLEVALLLVHDLELGDYLIITEEECA